MGAIRAAHEWGAVLAPGRHHRRRGRGRSSARTPRTLGGGVARSAGRLTQDECGLEHAVLDLIRPA
jgi:hypothetical protein